MVVLVNTQNSWKSLEGHFHKISQGCSCSRMHRRGVEGSFYNPGQMHTPFHFIC